MKMLLDYSNTNQRFVHTKIVYTLASGQKKLAVTGTAVLSS